MKKISLIILGLLIASPALAALFMVEGEPVDMLGSGNSGLLDWIYNRDKNLMYGNNNVDVFVIGGTATTTAPGVFEVIGGANFDRTTTTGNTYLGITGSTQCLQIDTNGLVSGAGAGCSVGGWSSTSEAYYWTTQDTDDLTEGTNLYYTQARIWDDIWASTTLDTILSNSQTAYDWGDHSLAGYYAAADFNTDWDALYNATTTLSGHTGIADAHQDEVTLAGETYITISGQVLTLAKLDIAETNLTVSSPITLSTNDIGFDYTTANTWSGINTFSSDLRATGGLHASTTDFDMLQVNGNATTTGSMYIGQDLTVLNGNVGIGTTDPSTKLEVVGDITIFSPTPIFVFKDSNSSGAASVGFIEWRDSGGGRAGFLGNNSSGNDDLFWKNEQGGNIGIETTGAGDIILSLATGNVGIGTTTPNSLLTVDGTFAVGTDGTEFTVNADGQVIMNGSATTTAQFSGIFPNEPSHFATKEYVDTQPGNAIDFDFTTTTSDIDDQLTYLMEDIISVNDEAEIVSGSLTTGVDDQFVTAFAIASNTIPFATLEAGRVSLHMHAARTGGNDPNQFYFNIIKREDDQSETILVTSELSSLITTKDAFTVHATMLAEVQFVSTDRLLVKIYVNTGGTGLANEVTFYVQGVNASRLEVGVPSTAFNTVYIRLDGTIGLRGEWDTGSFGLIMPSATSSDSFYLPALGIAAGARLAVDATGKVIATTTPPTDAEVTAEIAAHAGDDDAHQALVTITGEDYASLTAQQITFSNVDAANIDLTDAFSWTGAHGWDTEATFTGGLIINESTTTRATTTSFAITGVTGSTQCLQVDTNGTVSGSGGACGGAGSDTNTWAWISTPGHLTHNTSTDEIRIVDLYASTTLMTSGTTSDSFYVGGILDITGNVNTAGTYKISGTDLACSDVTNCVDNAYAALTDMTLTDTYIYVGNGSANPVGVAMSSDCTIDNVGAITCDHNALDNFVADEHLNWKNSVGTIHTDNYIEQDSELTNWIDNVVLGTNGDLETEGYASSTTGLFTQGAGHIGEGFTVDGNVGIGTTTPNSPLDVLSTTIPQFRIGYNTEQYTTISHRGWIDINTTAPTTNQFRVYLNGTEQMRINEDGNVGIGLTSPTSTLAVNGDIVGLGYASSTTGLFTQGDSHIGGSLDVDGNVTTTGQFFVETERVVGYKNWGGIFASTTLATAEATTTLAQRMTDDAHGETFVTGTCFVDTGTTTIACGDGTNISYFDCPRFQADAPANNKFSFSSNNTFTADELQACEFGNPLGSPTEVNWEIKRTINPD